MLNLLYHVFSEMSRGALWEGKKGEGREGGGRKEGKGSKKIVAAADFEVLCLQSAGHCV